MARTILAADLSLLQRGIERDQIHTQPIHSVHCLVYPILASQHPWINGAGRSVSGSVLCRFGLLSNFSLSGFRQSAVVVFIHLIDHLFHLNLYGFQPLISLCKAKVFVGIHSISLLAQ